MPPLRVSSIALPHVPVEAYATPCFSGPKTTACLHVFSLPAACEVPITRACVVVWIGSAWAARKTNAKRRPAVRPPSIPLTAREGVKAAYNGGAKGSRKYTKITIPWHVSLRIDDISNALRCVSCVVKGLNIPCFGGWLVGQCESRE